jgi:hypothetical protein
MSRYLIRATVVVAGLALVFAAMASGKVEVVRVGNLIFTDNGGISPSTLPRHGSAPITAHIIGTIGTADGTHPPALRSVEAEIDKTISIDPTGIPTCEAGQIEALDTASAKRACGDATVGSGTAEVEVAFPEQAPFSATGPVVLFNGGVHGKSLLVFVHAYVNVPAPTAIVTRATVTSIDRGRFGHALKVTVPAIAGGYGSATKFDVKIGRAFTYKGQKKSFLTASCPTGSWMTRGKVKFQDRTELSVSHVFPCTPKG